MFLKRGKVIRIQTDFAEDLPEIRGVEGEIREALTNLFLNAFDAMPEGGTLTLRTRLAEDGQILVEVTDTGIGMDEDTQKRALEPFFTTKGERGTGLGLAMVYGMFERHSAQIELECEPGKGTTVCLIFAVSIPVTASSVHSSARLLPAQRLRLLIVDDDPLLTKSLRDILESDGHLITATDGGQAGIEAFVAAHESGEGFAAVLTDLGMPYVDGRKVAAAVKAASPTTPVIMLTGWGQRLITEHDVPPHVDRVLSKPPRLYDLRTALVELTASGRTPELSGMKD
jgi:CheY-like chemotaxis protein/anti-sigma regulatory factor (Ser/Thr protein kinase)